MRYDAAVGHAAAAIHAPHHDHLARGAGPLRSRYAMRLLMDGSPDRSIARGKHRPAGSYHACSPRDKCSPTRNGPLLRLQPRRGRPLLHRRPCRRPRLHLVRPWARHGYGAQHQPPANGRRRAAAGAGGRAASTGVPCAAFGHGRRTRVGARGSAAVPPRT